MAAMQSALRAKGLHPSLKEMLNVLDGDPEHKETELGLAMSEIFKIMNRKTDERPPPAKPNSQHVGNAAAAGATPKTVCEFEAELQNVPNSARQEWLRKNKDAIKVARALEAAPNALLKKGNRR